MTELSALAGSEGYAACDDDGGLYCQKRPSRAFFDSLITPPVIDRRSFYFPRFSRAATGFRAIARAAGRYNQGKRRKREESACNPYLRDRGWAGRA